MAEPRPFPKIRRLITRNLNEGLTRFGFSQFGSSNYFIRDRGPVRDAMFFQKMRSHAVTIAYGVSLVPDGDDWSPGLRHARWLSDQQFYVVKYEEHVAPSINRALDAFEREALPYFARFQTTVDVSNVAEPL